MREICDVDLRGLAKSRNFAKVAMSEQEIAQPIDEPVTVPQPEAMETAPEQAPLAPLATGPLQQPPMIGPVAARNHSNTTLPLGVRLDGRYGQRLLQPTINVFERMAESRNAAAAESAAGAGGGPELAAHERDRAVKRKTDAPFGKPDPKRRGPGKETKTKEPNVPVGQRVREFPEQSTGATVSTSGQVFYV